MFPVFERFGVLGDRLLSLVVPEAEATAASCGYEYLPMPFCYRRYCCTGPNGRYCTSYKAC